jgi:hypothetical protein
VCITSGETVLLLINASVHAISSLLVRFEPASSPQPSCPLLHATRACQLMGHHVHHVASMGASH